MTIGGQTFQDEAALVAWIEDLKNDTWPETAVFWTSACGSRHSENTEYSVEVSYTLTSGQQATYRYRGYLHAGDSTYNQYFINPSRTWMASVWLCGF